MSDVFVDRSCGMKTVIAELQKRGVNLSELEALEVFAREGDWQTTAYMDLIKSLEAWEIDPLYEKNLRKNLPNANVSIIDSINEISKKKEEDLGKYDLIVIDNPQNCYGAKREYCEHFDVVPHVWKIMKKRAIVIFNINRHPFNYETFPDWKSRREKFYGSKRTSDFNVSELLRFYVSFFSKGGIKVKDSFSVERERYEGIDYLHYLVFILER